MNTRSFLLILILSMSISGQAFAFDMPSMSKIADLATRQPVLVASDIKAAQKVVDQLGQAAIQVMANTTLSESAKKQAFKTLLSQNFDMPTIARFAIGKYWRTATQTQKMTYLDLFQKMVIDVYTARFNKYSGQTFEVVDSRLDSSGDVVVTSRLQSPNTPPVSVEWRMRPKGASYRVIDVMVEGVSMAVTQRQDFAGVIQQGGGTVESLLDYLKKGGTSDVKK
jgi:phospholipid transport system substrate-binding protein